MKIKIADTYEQLSAMAADDMIGLIRLKRSPLICTASGDSPAGLYRKLVKRAKKKEINIRDSFFVGLDEWVGMNGFDEGSCRFHLNNHFFTPLNIDKQNICFFDGRAKDLAKECEATENFIRQHDGIDIAILGLGMNGHVGMNEPGTDPLLRSHVAEIAQETQQVGQKYFTKEQKLSHGLTMGIATLLDAKQLMLIVSGAQKAAMVKRVIEDEISAHIPTSLLRNHTGFTIYLDKAAASSIVSYV